MISNDTTTATEASESLPDNEGENNANVSDTDIRVPKFRLDQTTAKLRTAEGRAEALERQLADLSKAQPQKVEQKQEGSKFKDNYASIDEFYGDMYKAIAERASTDDGFLDKVLDSLYEKRGDKFDETLFNSLTRKNQKVIKEQDDITTKMVEENDRKLDEIESSFGTDVTGWESFKGWVTETLAKEQVPTWARDLDSLYDVYKSYIYQTPQTTTNTAKKISRSKVGGKVNQKVDISGDIHDVLRKMNPFE